MHSLIARCMTLALSFAAPGLVYAQGTSLLAGQQTAPEPQTGLTIKKESAAPPLEWIDLSTGHRIVRLSREPGSSSLYFHQNAYTASGDRMVFATRAGLCAYNFKTRDIELLVPGRVSDVIVARRSRQVYYFKGNSVFATNLDTQATREVVGGDTVRAANLDTHEKQEIKLAELRSGSGLAINADETLLAGSYTIGGQQAAAPPPADSSGVRADAYPGKGEMMERRLAARLPMALYTINIKTGEVTTFNHSTDWLNHVQFSPTDAALLMFCHEGPWHKVDRIWTIRIDGTGLRKIHIRTMDMEIAGHEFFSADGRTVWYDLQTPKGKEFWLAGVVLATGQKIRYQIPRDQWSVHFNASPDGKLFAGDGGGPHSVAAPGNGQWIYLFRPNNGSLSAEKLVNLANHDYSVEPNVTFTPDGRWIVFRSNMYGPTQVYAVEVDASQKASTHQP